MRCPDCGAENCVYCGKLCTACQGRITVDVVISNDGMLYHPNCRPAPPAGDWLDIKKEAIDAARAANPITIERLGDNMATGTYTVTVPLVEVEALRQVTALLRRLYEPGLDPWERYIIQEELQDALAAVPVNDHDAAVADLVRLRNDLA